MRTATPPTTERRALLAELMARLPGDPAAEVGLLTAFGPDIARHLVALARQHGVPAPHGDDLEGLVIDACEVIATTIARWWKPDGGALPWVYGHHRMLDLLRRHQGPPTSPLPERDDVLAEPDGAFAAPPADRPVLEVLADLAHTTGDPVLAVVHDALGRAVPAGDRALVLHYVEQLTEGDRSPSATVGAMVGRSPAAVRQAYCRARRRLRTLAEEDVRFAPLLRLHWLADGTPAVARAEERAA